MKILIIDDEEDIRVIAGMSLGLIGGIQVIEAGGGESGVRKAQAEKPDVILLDMIMPDMDGAETICALKSHPETREIPVIFVTTKALNSDIERMKQLGAAGVLSKPFDPTLLASQVMAIVDSHKEKQGS